LQVYDFYITPEEYEEAAKIGITKKTLDKRIRYRGWDKCDLLLDKGRRGSSTKLA